MKRYIKFFITVAILIMGFAYVSSAQNQLKDSSLVVLTRLDANNRLEQLVVDDAYKSYGSIEQENNTTYIYTNRKYIIFQLPDSVSLSKSTPIQVEYKQTDNHVLFYGLDDKTKLFKLSTIKKSDSVYNDPKQTTKPVSVARVALNGNNVQSASISVGGKDVQIRRPSYSQWNLEPTKKVTLSYSIDEKSPKKEVPTSGQIKDGDTLRINKHQQLKSISFEKPKHVLFESVKFYKGREEQTSLDTSNVNFIKQKDPVYDNFSISATIDSVTAISIMPCDRMVVSLIQLNEEGVRSENVEREYFIEKEKSGMSVGAIVGIAVGGGLMLLALIGLLVWSLLKHNKEKGQLKNNQALDKQNESSLESKTDVEPSVSETVQTAPSQGVSQDEVDRLQAKIDELQKALEEKANTVTPAVNGVSEEQYEALVKENEGLRTELEAKQKELEQTTAPSKITESDYNALVAEKEQLEKDLEAEKRKVNSLQNNPSENEAKLISEKEELNKKITSLNDDLINALKNNGSQSQSIAQKDQDIKDLNSRLNEMSNKVNEAESAKKEAAANAQKLSEELNLSKEKINSFTKTIQDQARAIATANSDIQKLNGVINENQIKANKELSDTIARYDRRISDAEKAHKSEIEGIKTNHAAEVAQLNGSIEGCKSELALDRSFICRLFAEKIASVKAIVNVLKEGADTDSSVYTLVNRMASSPTLGVDKFVELSSSSLAGDQNIEKMYENIRKNFIEDLVYERSWCNNLARLYAYSHVKDDKLQDAFGYYSSYKEEIEKAFREMQTLASLLGITEIKVPSLFDEKFDADKYEPQNSGQFISDVYPDFGPMLTPSVIYDLIKVGYTDGDAVVKATVTYHIY